MFIDRAVIKVKAGDGGRGCVAFRRERGVEWGGPSGGDGGHGGSVILESTDQLTTLIDFHFRPLYEAARGGHGQGKNCSGRDADDLVLRVPLGTLVRDRATGRVVADLTSEGQRVTVAAGGKGGRGNQHFATARMQSPKLAEPGVSGEARAVELELRMLADVGLVGLPNAGKSLLLSKISKAHPEVADYPFTTKEPNLGVVSLGIGESFVVADLPGLIEGAAEGRGLGHAFLRHASRTRVLVHVVDVGFEQPAAALKRQHDTILKELEAHDPALLERPRILAGNKLDQPGADKRFAVLEKHAKARGAAVTLGISALTGDGVPRLVRAMQHALAKAPVLVRHVEEPPAVLTPRPVTRIKVMRDQGGNFVVRGRELERLVAGLDSAKPAAVRRLLKDLERHGVDAALAKAGARRGDMVRVGDLEFEYVP